MKKSELIASLLGVISLLTSCSKNEVDKLFVHIDSSYSKIHFRNEILETDEFNIIEYLYFYNGGGVSIGDINNDGLPDIYFSSNQQSNKLYLNRGGFRFDDITNQSNTSGLGNWKTGVNMVDVDGDGWLDIFVCGVGNYKKFNSRNQLLINNHNLTFRDATGESGLSFQGLSTQSAFFDYDLDGDLDMYLLNHSIHSTRTFGNSTNRLRSDSLAGDRLYRNDLIPNGHLHFTDVTKEAGVYNSALGYGLGIAVSDVNRDGFPDLYISNDFGENDYLYINQGNGRFVESAAKCFTHMSRFSMGNDMADINNDTWPDLVTLDMRPLEESVIKTTASEDSYEVWKFKQDYGFLRQVSRNTLQLNQGILDSGRVQFSDVAQLAGVGATDWSWGTLLFDADGDGLKDIFISNGIVRRPNDMDYINFISSDSAQEKMKEGSLPWVDLMPKGNSPNFLFRNINGLEFRDARDWFDVNDSDFSTGCAYGDLDSDGDLDLVVNRINNVSLVYRNNADVNKFLSIKLRGDSKNLNALGAKVEVRQKGKSQLQEVFPARGWQSSSDTKLSFGVNRADSIHIAVTWPDGSTQNLKTKQRSIEIIKTQSSKLKNAAKELTAKYFDPGVEMPFKHSENDFNAFNREGLTPYMLSTEGPPIAIGDVNGDKLDDVLVGGGKNQSTQLFIQVGTDEFRKAPNYFEDSKTSEDTDAVFFDADGDRDLDLAIVSGGQEDLRVEWLIPRLYLNDGRGNFLRAKDALPPYPTNASCVKPFDYDRDGDIDLFIGSMVMPMLYGMAPPSFLLDNNGKGVFRANQQWLGRSTFGNMTKIRPGMVSDAAWAYVNADSLIDLVLVGHWMPITILIQNEQKQFDNKTSQYGLANSAGWWNVIERSDLDNDGDADFVIGNLGLNSRLRATRLEPLQMYLGDFDSNDGSDHILVYYNGGRQYPFATRDQIVKQIPPLKKKFLKFSDYKNVVLNDIVTPVQLGNSSLLQVQNFESSFLWNNTDSLELSPMPIEAQITPIYAVSLVDLNRDNHADIIVGGNLTAVQPELGPYDAGLGSVLVSDGKHDFSGVTPSVSGFWAKGEIRSIKVVKGQSHNWLFVSRNDDTLLKFLIKN